MSAPCGCMLCRLTGQVDEAEWEAAEDVVEALLHDLCFASDLERLSRAERLKALRLTASSYELAARIIRSMAAVAASTSSSGMDDLRRLAEVGVRGMREGV